MSDNEEKRRPNANYQLSNRKNHDSIIWHYNREHRLEKAPQLVQEIYKERPRRRNLRALLSNKPGAITFLSIILICIMVAIASFANAANYTHNLDGNRFSIQAEKYENMVIVTLEKKSGGFLARFRPAYVGAVDITVLPVKGSAAEQTDQPEHIFNHTIMFTKEPLGHFVFTVPFDSDELVFVLKTDKKTLGVTVKTE